MIVRPPSSTRTDTLFPDTTRCRSQRARPHPRAVDTLVAFDPDAAHQVEILQFIMDGFGQDSLPGYWLFARPAPPGRQAPAGEGDRKRTRLNSSHYCATRMPYSS